VPAVAPGILWLQLRLWSLLPKGVIAGIDSRRCAEALQAVSPGSPLPIIAAYTYSWMPHNAGFDFLDLTPSILLLRQFWD
jgi:hypothetical protein